MNAKPSSGLFYHGTNVEVQMGDRIMISHWFRKSEYATVCYIPGLCSKNSELEYEGVRRWAYRLDSGTIMATGYFPEEPGFDRLRKHIHFVGRGEGGELRPEEIDDSNSTE